MRPREDAAGPKRMIRIRAAMGGNCERQQEHPPQRASASEVTPAGNSWPRPSRIVTRGRRTHMSQSATALLPDEFDQVDRANASGRQPVLFVHGLWRLDSSWDHWAQFFEDA